MGSTTAGDLKPLASPLFFQPSIVHQHQNTPHSSSSTPSIPHTSHAASNLDERPATANRTPEAKTPATRVYQSSTPESFERAQKQNERRRLLETESEQRRKDFEHTALENVDVGRECPPSPDDDLFAQKMAEEAMRAQSLSSTNSNSAASQMTSPSELQSPMSSVNLGSTDQIFPSVPSLPALVSGASSVSADTEGDMLQQPGVVHYPENSFTAQNTPDAATPPTLSKEPSTDVETPTVVPGDETVLLSPDDEEGYNGDGDTIFTHDDEDEDSDSDSDEGIMMGKRKPVPKASAPLSDQGKKIERRGTSASAGSTETAKKIVMDN